ncbi:MAG: hypothetical protein MUP49_00110 [Dehalococcoidia bacterium]|nr:hypothetical protein [Dehalococcoidia bacterium]
MSKIAFLGFEEFGPWTSSGNTILGEKEITRDLNQKIKSYDIVVVPFSPIFQGWNNLFRREEPLNNLDSNTVQIRATDLAYSGIKLALEGGSHICFLYCDLDMQQLLFCGYSALLGGRLLKDEGLVIKQLYRPAGFIPITKWLDQFVRQFSSGSCYFKYEDESKKFKHPLCCSDNDTNCIRGFALQKGRGLVYILPVNPVAIEQGPLYTTLSECLVNDISTRLFPQTAPITEAFQFKVEKQFRQKKQKVITILEQVNETIAKHQEPKDILFLRDDPLADRIPLWLTDYFEIRTKRQEDYVEDFWILDDKGKEVAICEVKGLSKNVKREYITALVQHREQRDLADDFPSILFVNTFADSESVEEKDGQRVVKLECQKAVKNHVLIVRTLDLVRMLDLVWQKKLDINNIRELLLSETGWLRVTEQGYEIFKN